MKYELGVTGQAISTITRRYVAIRNFLQYLEMEKVCVTDCKDVHIEGYVKNSWKEKLSQKDLMNVCLESATFSDLWK